MLVNARLKMVIPGKPIIINLLIFTITFGCTSDRSSLLLQTDPGSDHATKTFDELYHAKQLLISADSLLTMDPNKALDLSRKARDHSIIQKDKSTQAQAELIMADAFYYLHRLDSAIVHYQKANQLYANLEGGVLSEKYISTLGYIGNCYHELKDEIQAYKYFEKALEFARKAGNKPEIAANLANLGISLTIWGDYGRAIAVMEDALNIDNELANLDAVATDYNTIGKIYSYWGQPEKAIEYFQKALEIDRKLNNTDKISIRFNSIGTVYRDMGDYDLALIYFQDALHLDSVSGNFGKCAVRYHNIGETYFLKGQTAKAQDYLLLAKNHFRNAENLIDLSSTLYTLGKISQDLGDYRQSVKYLDEALITARSAHLQHQQQNVLKTYAEVLFHLGNASLAYQMLKAKDSISEMVFSTENSRQLSSFEARYKVKEASNQAEIFRKDASLRKKRMIILGISSASVVAILFTLMLLIRLKAINIRQEHALTEQKAHALNQELELRNKELALSAMNIIKNNEAILSISEALRESARNENNAENLQEIIGKIHGIEHSNHWNDFEVRFTQVHQDFFDKLDSQFPGLSPNERRLCAFLKLNMTTKEIASITFQSVKSINVARTRLRKKLGLFNTSTNISSFLSSI